MKIKCILMIIAFAFALVSCENENSTQIPRPIKKLIKEQRKGCLESVLKYNYQGQTVYYFDSSCPDFYETIYDENGNIVCQMGGISGNGDNKCPCFFDDATLVEEIWRR